MPGKGSDQITPNIISTALRKQDELKLKLAGMDYREIRDAMIQKYGRDGLPGSYDERYVWRDVQEELMEIRKTNQDVVTDLRNLESQRLDQIQLAIMPDALRGNLKAVDRMIRIMDHRAKLFGLYAPSQVKVTDWRTEIIDLIKAGKITIEQVEEEIGHEFTQQLLESGSTSTIEGRFTEEENRDNSEISTGRQMA